MIIESINQISLSGLYKIRTQDDCVFYVRCEYLFSVNIENICAGTEIEGEAEDELLNAGLIVPVEIKASEYLARAEQSRFGLMRKLLKKGFEKKHIEAALNYLEEKKYLDDFRYSTAWLNTRRINHYEGRTKLIAELKNRGICDKTAVLAVNDFFSDYDELAICKKAYQKFLNNGKQNEKLIDALLKAGFSYKLIGQAKEDFFE